ncbi:hypothetical protein SUGI_0965370 [Cryptomeria japonica]|nr:hypothetical protein SUGI_0965370 [Cryptomeria japonica]
MEALEVQTPYDLHGMPWSSFSSYEFPSSFNPPRPTSPSRPRLLGTTSQPPDRSVQEPMAVVWLEKGFVINEYVVGMGLVVPASASEGYAKVIELKEGDEDLKAAIFSLGTRGAIS